MGKLKARREGGPPLRRKYAWLVQIGRTSLSFQKEKDGVLCRIHTRGNVLPFENGSVSSLRPVQFIVDYESVKSYNQLKY